jgi:hypothetical protein
MVQYPGWSNVTATLDVPEAEQIDGVVEVRVTASPELAVALTVTGDAP